MAKSITAAVDPDRDESGSDAFEQCVDETAEFLLAPDYVDSGEGDDEET